jgi:choloylglycine hydrolase
MAVYPDEGAGVLANEPPYTHQVAALRTCTAHRGDTPDLPGDYSSPSRFVRAALLRRWAVEYGGACDPITQFFGILGAVSPVAGSVLTEEGKAHRTLYTCCMDGKEGVYRYRAEGEVEIRQASFDRLKREGKDLISVT